MNKTLSTPHPDNIMTNDIDNPTTRNNAWKYEAKILALKRYVQCELSTLHNKIDRFMETFNKTISTFETKPNEVLQDNIEFLQNELRSKDEIIKTLMETQIAVLETLPLSKPLQQTESNTSFQKDINQLNKNIVFLKGQGIRSIRTNRSIMGDSIIQGIRVREFNQQVKNGYAKFKSFPGCNSKEMLDYIDYI